MSKYNFPKIKNIVIRNFSLYSKDGNLVEVKEELNSGVYCLAGANGLGKTTFLNAINFGLTGLVLAPDKEVYSPEEIVKENRRYTDRYFVGRIKEKHKKDAEIEITLKVNNKYYRFIRGFFEKEALRVLEVYKEIDSKKISLISTDSMTPKQLKESYENELAKDVGLSSFDYFIFLQLYVFTFDENRRMVFWDERASSHTLAIAFNTNQNDIEKYNNITRRMEICESNGRNNRWQATQINNKINNLIKTKENNTDNKKIESEYEEIYNEYNEIESEYNNISIEYDTLLKRQSYLNSEIMHLRMDHEKYFSLYTEPRSKLISNSYIKMFLEKKECLLCGAKSEQVVEIIKNNLYKDNCPLCTTKINEDNQRERNKILEKLEENDNLIAEKNNELDELILETNGKKLELEKVSFDYNEIKERKRKFENQNPHIIEKQSGDNSIDYIIIKYKEQYDEYDKKAKDSYKERDRLKPEHKSLMEKIEKSYKNAEFDFVPIFKKLAKSFIGYDLNIMFSTKSKTMKLILELKDTARTESFHLSESQRFFLDIALRMALSIYLSEENEHATMLIDTPEGSLDIAYESRVGEMFASFVNDYKQNILMTANINASQLLISLAEKCSTNKMKFKRMLDWTDLSVIQKKGEALFEKVYQNIELALSRGGNERYTN